MSRRLIICCDGTWNTPTETQDGKACPTNVSKMATAITPEDAHSISQVAYYHPGVGTNWYDHIGGGVFGIGLSRAIKDCYAFLAQNYKTGDDLYFFGFSRGAYTARSLSGLLTKCGLVDVAMQDPSSADDLLDTAYDLYRENDAAKTSAFKARYSESVTIKMIGVWDTVGALGIPIGHVPPEVAKLWQFHDVTLSPIVRNAYQALAIDERRAPFQPCIWQIPAGSTQTLQQVWFAGVHSDIGGGYPETGLSNISLGWMIKKAGALGLEFDSSYVARIDSANFGALLHDSMSSMYRPLGEYVRPIGLLSNSPQSIADTARKRRSGSNAYRPQNPVALRQRDEKLFEYLDAAEAEVIATT